MIFPSASGWETGIDLVQSNNYQNINFSVHWERMGTNLAWSSLSFMPSTEPSFVLILPLVILRPLLLSFGLDSKNPLWKNSSVITIFFHTIWCTFPTPKDGGKCLCVLWSKCCLELMPEYRKGEHLLTTGQLQCDVPFIVPYRTSNQVKGTFTITYRISFKTIWSLLWLLFY